METKPTPSGYSISALSDHTDPQLELEHRPILVRPADMQGPHALEVRIRADADAEAVVHTLRAIAKVIKKEGLGVLRLPDDEGDWGWVGNKRNWVWVAKKA